MAVPANQARKCMRCIVRRWRDALRATMALLLLSGFACATAAQAPAGSAVHLGDSQGLLDAQQLAGAWVDDSGAATLDHVLQAGPAPFRTPRPGLIYSLGKEETLWLHYRLMRGRGERNGWLMAFPMPTLDAVTV